MAGNGMISMKRLLNGGAAALVLAAAALVAVPAQAQEEFPFGFVMTLDAARMPGSKRIPSIEVGDNGEVILELWCDGGKGQFSVAGNTIVFVPGAMENRSCTPERAQADKDLLAALSEMTSWRRQGDQVTFVGSKSLRYVINSN
ncbi:META domain-containing protein [Bradyrhizobium acaciae]|uniref:META domain-containing protein n=1 Tax=Bradyrhizobium acaciae TaxID=2683706 RepID=UPI001E5E27C8|nr:META domain-containing protein [Bradyrhizobium acaciae]